MNAFIKIMQHDLGFNFIAPSKNYIKIFFKYPFFPEIEKRNKHFYTHYYIHELYNDITYKYNNFNKSKFLCLKNILDNIFINDSIKEMFLTIICKTQKTYRGFSTLAKIWRYRKATIKNKEDLSMNPIEESSKTVKIFQNNSFFLFRVSELINIIETCITNTENYFSNPLPIKNPYNNMIFNLSTLYYIYYAIKNSTFIMPITIQYYFLCNFDSDQFVDEHENLIREIAIKNSIYKSNDDTLCKEIKNMLKHNTYTNRLSIHPDFPKKELVKIMKPFLLSYYRYLYSMIGKDDRTILYMSLSNNLKYFYLNNPQFGRINVKITKILCPKTYEYILKRDITFNTDANKFVDYF